MPPNVSNAARTDNDVLVLLEFDCTYHGLRAPQIPIAAATVSAEASVIY